MLEISKIHFLKITGMIDEYKKSEFVNTVKFACKLISSDCLVRSLAIEILEDDIYYFFCSWSTESGLKEFMKSEEYQLIRGAYDALGILNRIEYGYDNEIKTIQIG